MFYDAANHAMLTSDEVSIVLAASVRVCLSVCLWKNWITTDHNTSCYMCYGES